jgi:putative ABC transport system ATP-binding protein
MRSLDLAGVSYDAGRRLLSDVDVTFPAGRLTCLSGPSGAGKTTLLSVAGGLLPPTAGTVSYGGRPTWQGTGDPPQQVTFVLQVYGLVPVLSALENVSVALRARGVAPADADHRAAEALDRFHILDLADRQVEELSGGQLQRVALARAVAPDSEVVLADEPTSELDEGNALHVMAELRTLADEGRVVVIATHDPAVARTCDREYVLDEGRVIEERSRSAGAALP